MWKLIKDLTKTVQDEELIVGNYGYFWQVPGLGWTHFHCSCFILTFHPEIGELFKLCSFLLLHTTSIFLNGRLLHKIKYKEMFQESLLCPGGIAWCHAMHMCLVKFLIYVAIWIAPELLTEFPPVLEILMSAYPWIQSRESRCRAEGETTGKYRNTGRGGDMETWRHGPGGGKWAGQLSYWSL